MYIPFEICILFWCEVCFKCTICVIYLLITIIFGLQMSMNSISFVGYVDGAKFAKWPLLPGLFFHQLMS